MSDAPPLFVLQLLEREPAATALIGTWHAVAGLVELRDDDRLFRSWAAVAGVPIPTALRVGGMLLDLGICERGSEHPDSRATAVASSAVASRLVRMRQRRPPRPPS